MIIGTFLTTSVIELCDVNGRDVTAYLVSIFENCCQEQFLKIKNTILMLPENCSCFLNLVLEQKKKGIKHIFYVFIALFIFYNRKQFKKKALLLFKYDARKKP